MIVQHQLLCWHWCRLQGQVQAAISVLSLHFCCTGKTKEMVGTIHGPLRHESVLLLTHRCSLAKKYTEALEEHRQGLAAKAEEAGEQVCVSERQRGRQRGRETEGRVVMYSRHLSQHLASSELEIRPHVVSIMIPPVLLHRLMTCLRPSPATLT